MDPPFTQRPDQAFLFAREYRPDHYPVDDFSRNLVAPHRHLMGKDFGKRIAKLTGIVIRVPGSPVTSRDHIINCKAN